MEVCENQILKMCMNARCWDIIGTDRVQFVRIENF